MSINVNLNKGTACNYELIFPLLPNKKSVSENKELILNIYGTIIPSIALETTESKWEGKKINFHAGGIIYNDWTINYLVDSNLENWKLLYEWVIFVCDNKITPTRKINDYMVDATLLITDNYYRPVRNILFKNIWPTSLSEILLSNRNGETMLESEATFSYDRYEII